MENNFFVGVVVHRRRKNNSLTREKLVLYSRNDIDYIDLLNNNVINGGCDTIIFR